MENNYNPNSAPSENTPQGQNPNSATPGNGQVPPRAPYGYNPYTGKPNPAPGSAQVPPQNAGQNAYGGAPYQNMGQNGYCHAPQGQNPYGNPYNQRPPYTQPPYTPQPPYGQNGYYGYPRNAYTMPQPDPLYGKKQEERRVVKSISVVHGLCVFGFSILAMVISFLLVRIPGFYQNYTGNTYFSNAFDAVFSLLVIAVPFLIGYLVLRRKKRIGELPLGTPYDGKAAALLVFIGLAVCIAGSYVSGIFGSLIESMFGITFTMPEDTTVLNNVPLFLLYVLGMAAVPALVEEFAIRGVVMQSLRRYGDKFAIFMSALVFALMHGNMVQIPFAFIAGLMIGYAVIVTGSMWTGVAIHFLNNFVSVLMQAISDNLPVQTQNLLFLVMIAVIFLVGIVCAVVYFKTYARVPMAQGESILNSSEKNRAYIGTLPMILAIVYLVIETAGYVEF